MDDVSYYDDEDEHNDDDSDDDGSPNVGGFPPRVRDWKMSTTASSPLSLSTGHVETYLFNSFRNTISSGIRSTTIYEEVASLWTKCCEPLIRTYEPSLPGLCGSFESCL